MSDWPRPYHPIVDGHPDRTRTVLAFPHLPGRTDELATWCNGEVTAAGGGPVVLLPGRRPAAQRLVGGGDVAVQIEPGKFRAVQGGGFGARYAAPDADEAPPADGPEDTDSGGS